MRLFTVNNIYTALNNPLTIWFFFKRRINKLPYYLGDGKFAFHPSIIKLYINSKCNCKCSFCDVGKKNLDSVFFSQMTNNHSEDISEELVDKIICNFSSSKTSIIISGLEPLLHSDVISICKKLIDNGFQTSLVTNGVLLEKYAEDLIQVGLKNITVSLDGLEDTHDKIRGKGVFKQVIKGLIKLNQAKQLNYARTSVKINCCVSPENYSSLYELGTFVMQEKLCSRVSFTFLYFITEEACLAHSQHFPNIGEVSPTNYNSDYRKIDSYAVWDQLKRLQRKFREQVTISNKQIDSEEKLREYFHNPAEKMGRGKCYIPWTRATILSDGKCILHNRCFHYEVGNLKNQTFNEIWKGDKYVFIRQQLKKNKTFPVCERCCGNFN
jgi:MoaA/NifB/PqqE/SkfB family radical SAM enzyme